MDVKETLKKAKTKARCVWLDAKCWIYNKTRPAARWLESHPEEKNAIIVATVTTVGPMTVKLIRDELRAKRERDERDQRVYDPREGKYIYLRKKPTNQQWLRVEELERQGLSKTEACLRVGLL